MLATLAVPHEILIVGTDRDAETVTAAERAGARLVTPARDGYGAALISGWAAARETWFLTMDADLAHAPMFIPALWQAREEAEIVIGRILWSGMRHTGNTSLL